MRDPNTWFKDNQRVLLKGYIYKDVVVEVSEEGLRLTSESRPKYLDRLISWDSITQIEMQFCDNQYFVREYWCFLMKLKDYTGMLPYYRYMIAMTFDDKAMMERNVHITLNVDDETYQTIKSVMGELDAGTDGASATQRYA